MGLPSSGGIAGVAVLAALAASGPCLTGVSKAKFAEG
jgi:hypothetical protein